MNTITQEIVYALRKVLGDPKRRYALHEPTFSGNEWNYVKECIDTRWVSSAGKYVDLFEQRLAAIVGCKRAVVVSNGTSALKICLELAGVRPGDEVIVPTLTFVATANAVSHLGASVHLVDSNEQDLGIDAEKLDTYLEKICRFNSTGCVNRATGRKISAIVPVHIFGHPCDIESIRRIGGKYNIPIVEDAAEALGSRCHGRHVAWNTHLAAMSFNGNKIVTTGGGGAILCNDDSIADLAKHITTTAKVPHAWEYYHDRVAYNFRLPNLNAALGCAQLEQLEQFLTAKRFLANKYRVAFSDVQQLRFFCEGTNIQSNYWLNAIILDYANKSVRDEILEELNRQQLQSRPAWTLMHQLPMYQDMPAMDLSCAESLVYRIVNLPSSVDLLHETSNDTSSP